MKTIADIAKIAGVSKSTVSRYLNHGSISEKTKAKLDKIVMETNYQPNQFAQSLRAKRTSLIGVIVPRMNSHAVDETLKGVHAYCQQTGYQMLLNCTWLSEQAELDALETFQRSKVDGIILMATQITDMHLKRIKAMHVPVIILGQEHEGLNCIVHDDEKAGHLIGRTIGAAGLKNVHYFTVSEADKAVGLNRKRGFITALAQYGIVPHVYDTTFQHMDVKQLAEQVLTPETPIDALVGATDTIALALHQYAASQRLSVQMICGFGGSSMTQMVAPVIQTIAYQYDQAGKLAMKQLHRIMQGAQLHTQTTVDVCFYES